VNQEKENKGGHSGNWSRDGRQSQVIQEELRSSNWWPRASGEYQETCSQKLGRNPSKSLHGEHQRNQERSKSRESAAQRALIPKSITAGMKKNTAGEDAESHKKTAGGKGGGR